MPVFREGGFLNSVFQIIKLVKDRVRNKIWLDLLSDSQIHKKLPGYKTTRKILLIFLLFFVIDMKIETKERHTLNIPYKTM